VADSPEMRYARSGDPNIAYQVVGKGGPRDIVYVPGWVSNVEPMIASLAGPGEVRPLYAAV
jgi:hypothetical protein